MVGLIGGMLRARGTQAVTLLLLSALTTAAAVAGPAALAAVDRTVVENEVGAASPAERTVRLSWRSNDPIDAPAAGSTDLVPRELGAFQHVYAAQFPVMGLAPVADIAHLAALTFREDACAHLTIVRGRCVLGAYEVVVGDEAATRYALGPGSLLRTDEVQISMFGEVKPLGNPRQMMVVGVYRVADASDLYWGARGFGNTGPGEREPVFTDRATLGYANSWSQSQSIDLVLPAGLLTAGNLDSFRRGVDTIRAATTRTDVAFAVDSQVPALLGRVEANRRAAHILLPVAFVPLVGLCLYVMYLAVSYGAAARRHELGLMSLRGVPAVRRWWFAAGESLTVIALGGPIGYLLGTAAVTAVTARLFHGPVDAGPATNPLPYAAGAVLAAAVACVLAQRREWRAPVVELLRGVPPRSSSARTATAEALTIIVAAVATFQLRAVGGGLVGVASFGPGLVIMAVALLAARACVPLAAGVARLALRRGRLGVALATVHLVRRPGGHRLLILLTVATALLGFAVASLDVASRARHERAAVETGAPMVATVAAVDARALLTAVRSVDATGAFAMAVAPAPNVARGQPPVLAVDASRLSAVAVWRDGFGVDPARLAALLRPPAPDPFVLRGGAVSLDLDDVANPDGARHGFVMTLAPLAGGPAIDAAVNALTVGRRVYTVATPACASGCRVASVRAVTSGDQLVSVVVRAVRAAATGTDVVPPAQLADGGRWRSGGGTLVRARGDGLEVTGGGSDAAGTGLIQASDAQVVDAPVPLPLATAGPTPRTAASVVGFDQGLHQAVVVARPAMLPRLGAAGSLVDLEYLERTTLRPSVLPGAQVWLGPAAPADAVDRLGRAGLRVTGLVRPAERERALARQGPALALWCYLVAALQCVLVGVGGIGLMAAVDRRRADDLRRLRWQGLSRRDTRRAGLASVGVVVVAASLGLAATWLAWLVAGGALPVFADDTTVVGPRWPAVASVLWPCAAAAATFAAVAALTALRLGRVVARDEPRPG